MKTPSDRHPHGALQRDLQALDAHLWVEFIPRLRRWAVLYEGPRLHVTPPGLIGLPGCCGEYTRWQVAKTIWDRKGRYLNPSDHHGLIVAAVAGNDSDRSGSIQERCARVDRAEEERKSKALTAIRTSVREAARTAWDTVGVGKTMSTPAGMVDYRRDN